MKKIPRTAKLCQRRRRDGCALDFQIAPCDAFPVCGDFLGRAARHDASARFAALRAHVNHVIGVRDEIEVVLDHHHGSSLFNESLKYAEERFHIARVQANSGLVEHEHGIGLPAAHLAWRVSNAAPRRPKARAWLRRA